MRFLLIGLYVVLLFVVDLSPSLAEEDPDSPCAALVRWAAQTTANRDAYLEAPLVGDPAKNQPFLMWSRINHYEVTTETDESGGSKTTYVPVYDSYTIFGLMRLLNYKAPPDSPWTPHLAAAIDAIGDAWYDWSGPDMTKPVPWEASREIFKNAEQKCASLDGTE